MFSVFMEGVLFDLGPIDNKNYSDAIITVA